MDPQGAIIDACYFAAEKHITQRRKGDDSPYINHPIGVAYLLWKEGGIKDVEILQAAVLHDTVEDTDTTLEEVEIRFGPRVASLVAEVSDDKTLGKVERKKHQVEHAPKYSNGAKLIKLADKLYNCRDLLNVPPKGWSLKRIQGYFVWARTIIEQFYGTNKRLEELHQELWKEIIMWEDVEHPLMSKDSPSLQEYYDLLE